MQNSFLLILTLLTLNSAVANEYGIKFRDLTNGKEAALAPCPSTPNCVTSFDHPGIKSSQKLESLSISSELNEAKMKIKMFATKEGGKLETETGNYLRYKFTHKYLGLSDQTEFYFPNNKTVHFRSASEINLFTDLGSNLRRIERLKEQL